MAFPIGARFDNLTWFATIPDMSLAVKRGLILLVLLALAAAGLWAGLPAYRGWKERRALRQAETFYAQSDWRNATLAARTALVLNPSNAVTCRLMARIAERIHSPATLDWWTRVVAIEPGSLTNRLELARSAIVVGAFDRAAQALQGVAATNQNHAGYHQMAALVAIGYKNLARADWHLGEALKLEPGNQLLQMNRAVIHLQAKDPQVVAEAVNTLARLTTNSVYRLDAMRHLALAAEQGGDFITAEGWTRQLQAEPKATLDDRLLHLTMLQRGKQPGLGDYLVRMESDCATNAGAVAGLSGWLIAHDQADEATHWLAALPADLQTNRLVAFARADALVAQKDWSGLENLLAAAQWSEMDFLRQAMLARASREQRQELGAQAQWRMAVRSAAEQPRSLAVLARMAAQWHWASEQEDVLWRIADRFPTERWALRSLNDFYQAAGNTRSLRKVYAAMMSSAPDDLVAQNNYAVVSLLLNVATNQAHELAGKVYSQQPGNSVFASTQAYSLYLQGRANEALQMMRAFKPAQLEQPGVALYYGLLLKADNQVVEARKYFDIARKGNLLPEEQALLKLAQ